MRLISSLWLAAVAAQELHVLSHVPELVQVLWLPGDGEGRPSGELGAGGEGLPSSFMINTYAGHKFRFQVGRQSSQVVTQSGGQYDLVILSGNSGSGLHVELLSADDLQKLVQEMYSHCNSRDGYMTCCYDFLQSQRGIPSTLADKYINAYDPQRLMPRVVTRGDLEAELSDSGLDDDGYGAYLPPDEMVVVNNMPVAVDLHWVPTPASASGDVVTKDTDTTLITRVTSKSFVRLTAQPNEAFVVFEGSNSAIFRYSGELSVAIISPSVSDSPRVSSWDQDQLKIALSDIAQLCGEKSENQESFMECFKQKSLTFPPALAVWWFQLLWTSAHHWRHCVYLSDSMSIREVDLELDDGTGKNRSVKAQVLREKPLVLEISGLATPKECEELIQSQDLKVEDLGMAFVSGSQHLKSRRTLTRNLYPELADPKSILAKLQRRFFQAARGASGYDLWPAGQEPVNWLHYKPGYEYRPHCDGGCGWNPVPSGGRVASSLLYCNVAEKGGSTIFTKDTTKFTPKQGDFLFFAYKSDPKYMSMHAACPVLRGVKSTATQWYREGVDKDFTWEDVSDLGYRRTSEL